MCISGIVITVFSNMGSAIGCNMPLDVLHPIAKILSTIVV